MTYCDPMDIPVEERQSRKSPPEVLEEWIERTTPLQLYEMLKHRVIGQDEELRKAAVMVYGFISAMLNNNFGRNPHFLIEGQSGCGKSTFAAALEKLLPCPVVVADASSITPAGYKGTDIADWLLPFDVFGGCGVLVLDEIDKLMAPIKSEVGNFHLDALHTLLKLMDGGTLIDRSGDTIKCDKVLVIGMGAFSELREAPKTMRKIGFCAETLSDAPKTPFSSNSIKDYERGSRRPDIASGTIKSVSVTQTSFSPEISYQLPEKVKTEHSTSESSKTQSIITKERIASYSGSEQLLGRFLTVLHFKPLERSAFYNMVLLAEKEISHLYLDVTHGSSFCLTQKERNRIVDEAMKTEFGARAVRSAVWEVFLQRGSVIKEENPPTLEDRWQDVAKELGISA